MGEGGGANNRRVERMKLEYRLRLRNAAIVCWTLSAVGGRCQVAALLPVSVKISVKPAVFGILDLSNSVSGYIQGPKNRVCCRQRRVSDIILLY